MDWEAFLFLPTDKGTDIPPEIGRNIFPGVESLAFCRVDAHGSSTLADGRGNG